MRYLVFCWIMSAMLMATSAIVEGFYAWTTFIGTLAELTLPFFTWCFGILSVVLLTYVAFQGCFRS